MLDDWGDVGELGGCWMIGGILDDWRMLDDWGDVG